MLIMCLGGTNDVKKNVSAYYFFISLAFLAMFRNHAVYDPCVWHTHGTLKTHEK